MSRLGFIGQSVDTGAAGAVVPSFSSSPVLADSGFQTPALALSVGTPVSINLATFCPKGQTFYPVATTSAWNQGIWPPGTSMSSAGLFTGTPTTAGVWVVKLRAARGSRNPDASWTARSAGTYNSQRFDSASPITDGGASVAFTSWDNSVKRSGNGSMYQWIPAASATNTCSKWFFSTRTAQSYSGTPTPAFASNTGFNLGDEYYIQYSILPDRTYCSYPWGNYPKITILDMLPWLTNLNLGPTANSWEHVLIPGFGTLYGYINGPDGLPWSNFATNAQGDIIYQPNVVNTGRTLNGLNPGLPSGAGPSWTTNQQIRAQNSIDFDRYTNIGEPDGRPDPLTAMPAFSFDQWNTILIHMIVDVPPAQTISGNTFLSGAGLYEVSVAQDGQDYVKVFSETYTLRTTQLASPYFFRSGSGGNNTQATVFSGMCFTNLIFNLDISTAPLYQSWFDEIICSPSFIPAPDVGDGTGNYRTSDVLLTFKVS